MSSIVVDLGKSEEYSNKEEYKDGNMRYLYLNIASLTNMCRDLFMSNGFTDVAKKQGG